MDVPKSVFVKTGGQSEEVLTEAEEEEPENQEADEKLGRLNRRRKSTGWLCRRIVLLRQTGGANQSIVMFGHALTAIELPAGRTTRHRLATGMVETPLMGEGSHVQNIGFPDGDTAGPAGVAGRWSGPPMTGGISEFPPANPGSVVQPL